MTLTSTSLAYNSPVSFFIGQQPPEGLPDNVKGPFAEVYNSIQQIIQALINNAGIGPQPVTIWPLLAGSSSSLLAGNLNRFYVMASETILLGAAINLFNNAGAINARNANTSVSTKICHGFCTTPGGIASGTVGEVQLGRGLATITGLTAGTEYYLDINNGQIALSGTQKVGIGINSNTLLFDVPPFIAVIPQTNPNVFQFTASQALLLGNTINVFNSSGVQVRKANNSTGIGAQPCHGFCTQAGGIASGSSGSITLGSGVATVTGLTIGSDYYTSASDGLITATRTSAAGTKEQRVGIAIATNQLFFNVADWTDF